MSRDIAKYSCRSTLPVVTASVPAAVPGLVCVLLFDGFTAVLDSAAPAASPGLVYTCVFLSTEAVDGFTAVLDSVAPAVDPVVEVIVLGP